MIPQDLISLAIEPALTLLPEKMDTDPAKAMLVAIALQESGLTHRRQINGPARGWCQFEPIGVDGVMEHHTTVDYAAGVCAVLGYPAATYDVYAAISDNDVLAMAFARLLLWQYPGALPGGSMDVDQAWGQYISQWRPGRPRPEKWQDNYLTAWSAVC